MPKIVIAQSIALSARERVSAIAMGMTSDESDEGRSSSRGFYSLRNNCLLNGTKNTLAYIKQQRGKLYIVRRCVTMLLFSHKYDE